MDERLDSITKLLRNKQKELDDVEWENPSDPRIEGLVERFENTKIN